MPPPFPALYHEYKDLVFSLCLHYLRNRELAEEAAQDIFVKIHRNLEQFREESSIKTWIYRIAVHHCIDVQKAQQRRKRLGMIGQVIWGSTMPEPGHYDHPGLALEQQERVARLLELIETLPERQRTALMLSKIEGLSPLEIAAVLETSEGAVESILHRAKENLRKKMDKNPF
jgi:RNA polymerase sigma-70 factor (ECF subfamily)